jgi:hypothetical protein
MRRLRRLVVRALLALLSFAAGYAALLILPDPLFAYVDSGRFVTVHADEPLPPETREVIALAEARIESSPIFDPDRDHHVFVCNEPWRWRFFAGLDSGAGAIAYAPFGRAVFTREVRFERNRLIRAAGLETPAPRTASYFIAHEITHTMTADRLGLDYYELPAWVREGYADYVARGSTFDYDAVRAQLLAGDRELDPKASGLYLRYALLVTHLLEREGWDVEQLLERPPDRDALERRIRDGVVAPPP